MRRFPGLEDRIAREYLARVEAEPARGATEEDLSAAPAHELIARLQAIRGSGLRYRIDSEIARGGMGAVLRVRDTELDRELAMKVHLRAGNLSENRFLREARLTGRLNHPGVVPVHDLGETEDGRLFFTMRLVEGRTFKEVIDAHHRGDAEWPLSRALDVVVRVCETMAFAHSKGILHRDLKPSNVMVGAFGEVYVMDWGVARSVGDDDDPAATAPLEDDAPELLTLDGDVLGTPAYMAPEQALGKRTEVTRAADVYSVGALLYHLLAGTMPYAVPGEATSSRVILERVRGGEPASLRSTARPIPPELIAIQEKAMARDRAARYRDMRGMAQDLRAFLDLRVVSAYAATPLQRAAKWVRRNPGPSAGIAVALVAAAGMALFYFDQRAERRRVADVLGSTLKHNALQRTFESLWPLDETDLPHLEQLLADARAMLARGDALLAEQKELAAEAQPLDRTAPAEVAYGKRLEASLASKANWIGELEKIVREHDAGGELPTNRDRAFFVEQIAIHRKEYEQMKSRVVTQQTFVFDDPLQQVLFETGDLLAEQVSRVRGTEESVGIADTLERSIALVRDVGRRAPVDVAERWSTCLTELHDPAASPEYQGLVLREQTGLVPLGRDPVTHLFEFGHVLSGEIPSRDATGKLQLDAASCIVLVLLPPGEIIRGAQSESARIPHYDPLEPKGNFPYAPIAVHSFFLAKHEVSQAQWQRLTGRNPSRTQPKYSPQFGDTETHPVEYVSYEECAAVLARVGLTLPSEAGWEYAVRAGTDTPWFTGLEKESIVGYANIADRSAVQARATKAGRTHWWKDLDDGFPVHAPIDALLPNPFGLHGMLGNVQEWCCDDGPEDLDRAQEEIRDQSRMGSPSGSRPIRGGSYALSFHETRSAARRHAGPTRRDHDLGVRASRLVEQ